MSWPVAYLENSSYRYMALDANTKYNSGVGVSEVLTLCQQ